MIRNKKNIFNLKSIYHKLFPAWTLLMGKFIQKHPKYPNISVLDLGCGKNSPIQHIPNYRYSVGVDLYKPYIKESRKKKLYNIYIYSDLRKIKIKSLLKKNIKKGKKYDVVLLLGVIEHLTKEEGKILLNKMEKLGKWKVVFTTNGFQQQPKTIERETKLETKLQKHKSGYKSEDFIKRGYKVFGVCGFKFLVLWKKKHHPNFMFINHILNITSFMTRRNPKLAGGLLCIKNKGFN